MSIDALNDAGNRIARFIINELEYEGPAADLTGSQPVRLKEAIDSAALMELVAFVEDAFSVRIDDDEIVPENFATVADIVRLLHDKGFPAAPVAPENENGKSSRR